MCGTLDYLPPEMGMHFLNKILDCKGGSFRVVHIVLVYGLQSKVWSMMQVLIYGASVFYVTSFYMVSLLLKQ